MVNRAHELNDQSQLDYNSEGHGTLHQHVLDEVVRTVTPQQVYECVSWLSPPCRYATGCAKRTPALAGAQMGRDEHHRDPREHRVAVETDFSSLESGQGPRDFALTWRRA